MTAAIYEENLDIIKFLVPKTYININEKPSRYTLTPLEQVFRKSYYKDRIMEEILDVLLLREDLQVNSNTIYDYIAYDSGIKIDLFIKLFRDPRFEISKTDAVCGKFKQISSLIFYITL